MPVKQTPEDHENSYLRTGLASAIASGLGAGITHAVQLTRRNRASLRAYRAKKIRTPKFKRGLGKVASRLPKARKPRLLSAGKIASRSITSARTAAVLGGVAAPLALGAYRFLRGHPRRELYHAARTARLVQTHGVNLPASIAVSAAHAAGAPSPARRPRGRPRKHPLPGMAAHTALSVPAPSISASGLGGFG